MPDVIMKNLFRFSSIALVCVGSILGGPRMALSFPVSDSIQSQNNILENNTESSISSNIGSYSDNNSKLESESSYQLISSSKFGGISSSIGNSSDSFSDTTLSDSSSSGSPDSYSGNSNPASYYWYRRNKNKNISPSNIKSAFMKRSDSFSSKYSETLSNSESPSNTSSGTLNSTFSKTSSRISPRLGSNISASSSNTLEVLSESVSGASILTNSFSQSF